MARKPLSETEVEAALDGLTGWEVRDGKLSKEFKFGTFAEAIGWMMSVGIVADGMDHHPEWSNVYNKVQVNLVTHDLGNAISSSDVTLAIRMNELAGEE